MKYSGRIDSLKILLFHDLSHTYYHVEQRVKYRFQLSSFDLTLRWIVARCTYMLCNVTLLPSFSGNCFHHASCCISLFLWKLITGKLVNSEINQCSKLSSKLFQMNASNSLTQSRPLYSRNGLIALLFQPFLGEMLFLPSDLLFHNYLWLLQLYLSSHITPEIVLNITKTVKIYWYISTFFKVLMICLIFQFLRASYA